MYICLYTYLYFEQMKEKCLQEIGVPAEAFMYGCEHGNDCKEQLMLIILVSTCMFIILHSYGFACTLYVS